jgi:septal ring factor EnvC (AmiA/AmiB activator)
MKSASGAVCVIVLILLTILAGISHSQEKGSGEYLEAIKREEGVLERLRKEIIQNEKEKKKLSKKESDVLSEIHRLEKKVDLTDRLIRELESDVSRRKEELAELEKKIVGVRSDLGSRQEAFYRRLRGLYKMRRVNPLEIVLGSSSFSSAFQRVYYLTRIAREDKRRVSDYLGKAEDLADARKERSDKLREIAARMDEVRREKKSLLSTRKEKARLLASVKGKKKEREEAIKKLQEETDRLTSLIGGLEKKRLMAVERERKGMYDLDKAIGMLRWPVAGKVITGFGRQYNPDLGTNLVSNGIDIRADKGENVLAIAPGKVEFSDWWQSYGKMVIISHGGGFYSLYAHLSRVLIGVGEDVNEGDVVGEVGDTGSLSGAYLHFEIRKGREAVDPLVYLRKR